MSTQSRLELLKCIPFDLRVEILENEMRKDFTESEKAYVAEILKPYFQKQTKQGNRNDIKKTKSTSPNMLVKVKPETVNEKIAKVLGESDENVRRREIVFEKINKDAKKDLDSGKKTLNSLYQRTIAGQNASRPDTPLPTGKFTDIVEDPGWYFGNKNIGGSGKSGAAFHYKTEPTNKIARIPVHSIAADNAVLYMWTTNQHLITGSMLVSEYYEILWKQKLEMFCKKTSNQDKVKKLQEQTNADNELLSDMLQKQKVQNDAIAVMHCHGFAPKCIITWEKEEKEGWGGYWMNNVTEHLLIGIRGKIPPFGLQEKTIVKSKYVPRSHSKKPEVMWDLIEKCVAKTRGKHRKLEMNCRHPRKGWYPHGDQITTKDIQEWQKLK